jgi:hypothetical protein
MTNLDDSVTAGWPSRPPEQPPTVGFPPPAVDHPAGWAPGAVPPLPPAPPPASASKPGGRGRGPLLLGGVFVVLALLAAAFVAGMKITTTSSDSAAPPSSAPSTTTPPSTSKPPAGGAPSTTAPSSPSTNAPGGAPADDQAVKAEVEKLKSFVEQDRGLKYKNDVNVSVLSPNDFQQRVLSDYDKTPDQNKQEGELLQALGIVPADVDPVQLIRSALGSGVLGFYDPESKELVVGNTQITPFWDEIMTHELTHAIDDQNFNLNRPDLDKATDGTADAWQAFVEGSARRVEYDYVRSLPKDTQKEIVQEELSMGSDSTAAASIPPALALVIQSPYDYGEPFIRSLLKDKGQPGLDAAFTNPPKSTEQILQPDKFESGDNPKAVDKPPADGDVLGDGTLGELLTGFALNGQVDESNIIGNLLGGGGSNGSDPNGGGSFDPNQILNGLLGGGSGSGSGSGSGGLGSIDPSDPSSILSSLFSDPIQLNALDLQIEKADEVKNWGGDHYVLYRSGSNLCVRTDWTMDSPQDLSTFTGQLNTWATKDHNVKIDHPSDSVVRATRCVATSGGSSSGTPGI